MIKDEEENRVRLFKLKKKMIKDKEIVNCWGHGFSERF